MKIVGWGRLRRWVLVLVLLCVFSIYFLNQFLNTEREVIVSRKTNMIQTNGGFLGNFEPESTEVPRDEPGGAGKPNYLRDVQDKVTYNSLQLDAINVINSSEIALNRSIPDTRLQDCKYWNYPEDLPKASVIIVFHNEVWSTLLRTIYSVINRTPSRLLEEIILVDDFSDLTNLKADLDNYLEKFNGKVRLIRSEKREGLIRTKNVGARNASGEVIVFLDSHCEVNVNWLPPLLVPIYRNRTTMTVPVVDVIDRNTFEYHSEHAPNEHYYGYFEWGLVYREYELPAEFYVSRRNESEPYKTPAYSGLLAMDRKYFLSLEAYDPYFFMQGGENFYLSFKIWMCGGNILRIPCSRVGRAFKMYGTHDLETTRELKSREPAVNSNLKRVIEIWFDTKFKHFFYTRDPLAWYLDHGDTSDQLALKEKLKCKSFQWYMNNIPYDPLPEIPRNRFWGVLRNLGSETCIHLDHTGLSSMVQMKPCHGYGYNQFIRLNFDGQLSIKDLCIDGDEEGVEFISCPFNETGGPWVYYEKDHFLTHRRHNKCMAVHLFSLNLVFRTCRQKDEFFQWVFEAIKLWW